MSAPATERGADVAQDEKELLERCERLVELAKSKGAEEAEAFGHFSEVTRVDFEQGDLKMGHVDDGTSIGLRVFREW